MSEGSQRVYGGRYEIESKIARGGMADVFRARDNLLDRPVALKVLFAELSVDPSFVERFRREAQNAARLSHPNIVSVYDWGEEANTYYIVMELVEGESVSALLRQQGKLSVERAAAIGAETASALAFAHKNGVIHRDVKPGNILIDSRGSVKVTDFGIARARNTTENLTQTGAVMGTATYFSPEQAQGLSVDPRSDVYSLGVVLYEMVAGVPPFKGDNPVTIAYKHVREEPPPLSQAVPSLPHAYQAIVAHSMAKAPGNRYNSADELRTDLERFRRGQPIERKAYDATQAVAAANYTQATGAYGAGGPATQAVPTTRTADQKSGRGAKRWKNFLTIVIGLLAFAGILAFLYMGSGFGSNDEPTQQVTLGNFVGSNVDSATNQLQGQGLTVRTTRQTSDEPEDNVISQDPGPGRSVDAGSTVTLTVSTGPQSQSLPNVVNQSFDQARDRLQRAGFSVTRTSSESDSVPEGRVISQNPSAGTRVGQGSTVTLTVSTGTRQIEIPDVEGFTRDAAVRELTNNNLNTNVSTQESDEPAGTVLGTNPSAGSNVARNSTVTVLISSGPTASSTTTSTTRPTPRPPGQND